jgi:two-component system, NtrC family, response regulator GlrR
MSTQNPQNCFHQAAMVRPGSKDSIFIGESPAFVNVLDLIGKVSRCDVSVLIQGETGTGKELAARAIHYSGARRDAPFVPINCGAIPDTLVESELFGHVRGAFTDAREARAGVVAQAEGGTLFLDEIEAMNPRAQIALLRFLQSLEYRPLGASAPKRANLRIIAASNVNLSDLASKGNYRSDLLFRLNVFVIDMPPLRSRQDDVLLLAEAFVERFCSRYGRPCMTLAAEYRQQLLAHDWPGNVRELENTLHRKVLLTEGNELHSDLVRSDFAGPNSRCGGISALRLTGAGFREAKALAIAQFERSYLTELLGRTDGNVSMAARMCGQERSRLNKLVRKHRL